MDGYSGNGLYCTGKMPVFVLYAWIKFRESPHAVMEKILWTMYLKYFSKYCL